MAEQIRGSLSDKIANILNTAPANFDPEEESVDATHAQVLKHGDPVEEDIVLSKFRRQNIELLSDIDHKYAGKPGTRKSLVESDSDKDISSSNNDDDCQSEESEDRDAAEEEESQASSGQENDNKFEDEDGDTSDAESLEKDDADFKHMTVTNVSNQMKKGMCVRNQVTLWENLLELRIQLQKCLIGANKMPKTDKLREIKESSGAEFSTKLVQTKNLVLETLDKLLLLQNLFLQQYPETKNICQRGVLGGGSDEEIPSDGDTDQPEKDIEETKVHKTKCRKRKLEELESQINEQHEQYQEYRNSVIHKWNDKTKVALKGGATSHSILDQIQYNLSNKEKLIKRTQLKRSNYTIVGQDGGNEDTRTTEVYDSEIFDDDDFYHQLLRELIEVKSSDITDPVQLGRQWIQLQSLRSKMKKKVDTRATKGRKIRYAVHSKLVNFMAPIDENQWTDEAKNELYNSLFGKNQFLINS